MIAAGHVIEFIAKITIAIVEVAMEQEICDGKEKDNGHPVRQKWLFPRMGR
jgi:hypothetical protein